jgi:iron-sulfur cluster assembly accessory protein
MTQRAETALITMTDRAASKMVSLLRERGDAAQVRVFVEGGGCSGYRYGIAPSRDKRDEDVVLAQGELTMVVDPQTLEMMRGASIDFVDDALSSGFTIDNPNAPPASSCGCGGGNNQDPTQDRCC